MLSNIKEYVFFSAMKFYKSFRKLTGLSLCVLGVD